LSIPDRLWRVVRGHWTMISDDMVGERIDAVSAEGRIMERIANQHENVIEEASKMFGVPEVDILAVITHESRGVATAGWWDRQLALCLLGALVQFGWEKALGAGAELEWWLARAAEGLRRV